MAYTKDPPPIGSGIQERQAYLDRELEKIEIEIALIEASLDILFNAGVEHFWRWLDDTATSDPGPGNMKGNQILLPDNTAFFVSKTSATQRFVDVLVLLPAGSTILVADPSKSASALYSITGIIDQGDWVTMGVSNISGDIANPTAGDLVSVIMYPPEAF